MNWKLSSVCCAGLEKEPASDLGYRAGHHDRALTRGDGENAALSASQASRLGSCPFPSPKGRMGPGGSRMSLPDNSIRSVNSIGCIAEPIGDGRYIIGRHPRAAACAVKFWPHPRELFLAPA
jgi:hypothetical protein